MPRLYLMCLNKIEINYVQDGNFWKHFDVHSGYIASVNSRYYCCAKDVHTLPVASLDESLLSPMCSILRQRTFKRADGAVDKHRQEVMVGKRWSVVVGLDSLIRDALFVRAASCRSFQVQSFSLSMRRPRSLGESRVGSVVSAIPDMR